MVRVGSKLIQAPAPWSTPFAVPRPVIQDDDHEDILAWLDLQEMWFAAGYMLPANGRVEFVAD